MNQIYKTSGKIESLKNLLKKNFNPFFLEVYDTSNLHSGHFKADPKLSYPSHLKIVIRAECFKGTSRLASHRMIHQLLSEAFKDGLHAVEIDASCESYYNKS
ncbi:MAG: BolA family protein [Rickettsiaceae bacterium]|nr:BolA family protein [Rickettsiaceae bacterium]